MEEDSGVKAPTTRLRRRLSVEQPESPSAPATPTKKRSTRLASKPQLELIDEHAVAKSPSRRTTRKSISRELTESEEKVITPARRSTRVKSNTSLNEADDKPETPVKKTVKTKPNTNIVSKADEKPITPARRATRVTSNTSITFEAVQNVDTPRAKRAARRLSQVGSDTEAPLTPTRTRRTRKSSTSSVDKDGTTSVSETTATPGRARRTRKGSTSSIDNTPAEASTAEKPTLISEVIAEEPENKLLKSNSEPGNKEEKESPTRKSPRIMAKKGRKSESKVTEEIENNTNEKDKQDNIQTTSSQEIKLESTVLEPSQNDISFNSKLLIKDCGTNNKKTSDKNKSMSDVDNLNLNSKRNRTKSWTTLTSPAADNLFFSDNESVKKKLKKREKVFTDKRLSEGDGLIKNREDEIDLKIHLNSTKKRRKSKENLFIDNKPEILVNPKDTSQVLDVSNESNKENILTVAPAVKDSSAVDIMLESVPSEVKTTIFLEDSDSNNGSIKQRDNKDQRVPIVQQPEERHETTKINEQVNIFAINTDTIENDSVEPMDIDETLPDSESLTVFGEQHKQTRKSSLCLPQENTNKTKRKSSLSYSVSQILDGSDNKNTETLRRVTQDNEISNITLTETLDMSKKSKRKSVFDSITQDMNSTIENENCLTDGNIVSKNENNKSNQIQNTLLSISREVNVSSNEKSKKKSSLSTSIIQDLEKTQNENKTTLVLSQIKDISSTESNASKSPQSPPQSIKDGPVNKNLTMNYLTSTPVQQKTTEKLAVQINTSIITPSNTSKTKNDTSNISEGEEIGFNKKKIKRLSESVYSENTTIQKTSKKNSSTTASSEDDSSDEESSADKNRLLDNIAEDAGDDYESGDSQDDEERQYAKENEITEKGETLTSEDEISNDSDYEKDSFLVSSDEEDYELLSGSGDDLGASDNELSMSAKSKKKFNERKLKQQKQASREMFHARHGPNISDKNTDSTKTKKNNRSRLDSTLLKSDEENLPPKKNKRMRLESSTLEMSHTSCNEESSKQKHNISEVEDIGYKKKKSKRLSDSVCNESVINEQEITISNLQVNNEDPLSMKIKQEQKTPQKGLEISTVQIHEEMEQVQVDENASMVIENNTVDPLQASLTQNNDSSDDGKSISENEEISNNYESMLKELNKETKRQKIKCHDISLNLVKKNKKTIHPIVEELNLTQTKLYIKAKDESKQAKEKSVKRVFKKLADTDDNSNNSSIDLKLLFSDESSGSEETDREKNIKETVIPLKQVQANTNIRNSLGVNETLDNLNNSKKKKKTRKSIKNSETEATELNANHEDGVLNFFIDTKGDLPNKDQDAAHENSDSNDAPVEVYYISNKKQSSEDATKKTICIKTPESENKNKKKNSESEAPLLKTPISEKKKKKLSESHSVETSKSDKPVVNKSDSVEKKQLSASQELQISHQTEGPKTPAKEKKKKRTSETQETDINSQGETTVNEIKSAENVTTQKRKRNTSANQSIEDTEVLNTSQKNESLTSNKKKKLKPSNSTDEIQNESKMIEAQEVNSKKVKETKNQEPEPEIKQSRKRKHRENDEEETSSKVFKQHSFNKVRVPRLSPCVIAKLEDKPNTDVPQSKAAKVVSTTEFTIEEAHKEKNKPSSHLEESILIDTFGNEVRRNVLTKKPKVLPFLPTVSTSDSGFTTTFKVNIIPQKMEFVAQRSDIPNFKNEYLKNKKLKKLRTYELYKKQRNVKLTKY